MTRILDRSLILVTIGGIACVGPAGGGAAQATTAATTDERGTLEEIVVTARKREETAQVSPVSVSAFSGAKLEKLEIRRMDDLQSISPGLNITQSASYASTVELSIRGINDPDTILTNDAPVSLYVDGVYIGRAIGSQFDLVDLDHVEVLRGPQGTLFGRNTTGGAISIFTKAPARDFGIEEKIGFATQGEFSTRTVLDTGEIGETGFSAKMAYRHYQFDGYRRNLQTPEDAGSGAEAKDQFYLAIHGDLTDDFTVDYKFDYDKESDQAVLAQIGSASDYVIAYFSKSPSFGGVPYVVSRDLQESGNAPDLGSAALLAMGHNLTLNYDFSDAFKIKSITAYRSFYENAHSTLGPGPMMGLVLNPATGGVSVQPVWAYQGAPDPQHQYQWSQELQFSGVVDRFNYVAGLYYFDEHVGEDNPQRFTFVLPPGVVGLNLTTETAYSGESESLAAYSQVSYTPPIFDDKLELTVGLRGTKDQKWLEQYDVTNVRNVTKTFYDLSESFTAKYQWEPQFMTYFRFAKAYKSGGFNARDPGPGYGPEKAKSYEGGLKADLLDRHVRIDADVYYTTYDQLQISQFQATGSGGAQTITVNAGAATLKGGELEISVLPAEGWQIDATAGYVDPEYDSYITANAAGTGNVDIAKTAKFVYISKATSSLRVSYQFPPMSIGDLTLATSWSYQGPRYFATDDNTSPHNHDIQAPAYNDIGAQVTLANIPTDYATVTAELYAKNLLGRPQLIQSIDFGPALGFGTIAYGRGRTVGFDLTAKF